MTGAPSPGPGERLFDPDLTRVDAVADTLPAEQIEQLPSATDTTKLPCAVFWLDLSGRITRWSTDCGEVFGLAERAAPKHFQELFTPADRDAGVPAILLQRVKDLGAWDGTGVRVQGDGSVIRVGSSISKVSTPNGLDIGFMVVTRDISRSMSHQRDAVDESAARMASLGRVASDVSHDVQSILTAIRGFAGALERHLPPSGAGHHLWHELLKACDRGTDVTRRLLGTGRPHSAEGVTSDVREIVSEIEPLLRQVVPARIDLTVQVDDSVPHVRLRPSDLELVLLNLVINARDAIEGEGLIAIEARRQPGPDGGARVVLAVRDTGHGMSAQVQERCLERAFTTKARGVGSGLGLALVRSMMEQAMGSIAIDSTPGVGTTMTLTLDATRLDQGVASAGIADEGGRLILVHTSANDAAGVVVSLLRRQGWRVARASGDAEVERLKAALPRPPALVILDEEAAKVSPIVRWPADGGSCEVPILHLRGGRGGVGSPVGRNDRELSGAFEPHDLVRVVAEMLDATPESRQRFVH